MARPEAASRVGKRETLLRRVELDLEVLVRASEKGSKQARPASPCPCLSIFLPLTALARPLRYSFASFRPFDSTSVTRQNAFTDQTASSSRASRLLDITSFPAALRGHNSLLRCTPKGRTKELERRRARPCSALDTGSELSGDQHRSHPRC